MSSEGKVSFKLKRFAGIKRDYTPEEVERLKGSIKIEHSICKQQSEKLWKLLNTESHVNTLGSLSGNQAVQHAKAGLKAIYLSGWQVAADANSAGEMYPDQSLYPYDSAPKLVEAMNNALIRADQIQHMEILDGDMKEKDRTDYLLPIVADGEADVYKYRSPPSQPATFFLRIFSNRLFAMSRDSEGVARSNFVERKIFPRSCAPQNLNTELL